ncbi:MAG: hypothetical protein Q7S85_11510 [Rugosibacter sp.]|nr:hypothetical protein [Rugosibacter sp.]
MQLVTQEITPSPSTPGCMRSSALIRWGLGNEFRLWVDVPEKYADGLSKTGNPWLVAMLPMAAALGEDIELPLPVDALLLENCLGVLAIWNAWYPELHQIALHCPVKGFEPSCAIKKTAAFFSGGIDSYFTIARRMPGNPYGIPAVGALDDLLTVWGFDVRAHEENQFMQLEKMLLESSRQLKLNHLCIRTNLRDMEKHIPFKDMWRRLGQCAGLGFISLSMENRYRTVTLGSTKAYGNLAPWGTHPLLDPLFSTTGLGIVHDGASFSRDQKTDLVAKFPPAHKSLHVCFAEGGSNCSQCDKCYRTMMTFDALGHRDTMKDAFDWSRYKVEYIKKFFIKSQGDEIYGSDITGVARLNGREDIVIALNHASRRSAILRPLVRLSEWMATLSVVWRLGVRFNQFLLKGPIRKI